MKSRFVPSDGKVKTLRELRDLLRAAPRDLLFLDMLVLCGLPLNRMVGLRGNCLRELDGTVYVVLPPWKEKPELCVRASAELVESLALARESGGWEEEAPLFRSRKGTGGLSLSGASRMVKRWEEMLGAKRSLAVALRNNGTEGVEAAVRVRPSRKRAAPRTRHGAFHQTLLHEIVNHKLHPGERLTIDMLCARYGVSRASVREALQKLRALGFVVKEKNKLFAAPLSRDDFHDILEARVLIESKLMAAAVHNISRPALNRLERLHREFVAQWNGRREGLFPVYDREFHLSIYKAANKPVFFTMVEWLWERSYPYLHLIERNYILEDCGPAHERMLIGLKNKDVRMAVEATRDNIIHGLEDLHDFFP